MSDYIKRDDALNAFNNAFYAGLTAKINKIPSEDVEPVRHGRWIEGPMCIECSCCGELFNDEIVYMHDPFGKPRYCPCCGSKMDGGDEDE